MIIFICNEFKINFHNTANELNEVNKIIKMTKFKNPINVNDLMWLFEYGVFECKINDNFTNINGIKYLYQLVDLIQQYSRYLYIYFEFLRNELCNKVILFRNKLYTRKHSNKKFVSYLNMKLTDLFLNLETCAEFKFRSFYKEFLKGISSISTHNISVISFVEHKKFVVDACDQNKKCNGYCINL